MIINQVNLDAAFTGFKVLFEEGFIRAPANWDKVAMLSPSTTEREVYPWLGQTTQFRQWIGDRVLQGLSTHGFTVVNEHFEDTVAIPRDKFEDDTYGVYSPIIQQLGFDASLHPDILIFSLFKNGAASLCYDGQYFFDTDHPGFDEYGNPTTYSNYSGAGSSPAWYLLDTWKQVKPFIFQKRKDYTFVPLNRPDDINVFMRNEFLYGTDARVAAAYGLWQLAYRSELPLTAANYATARAALRTLRADNGDALDIMPDLLVVDPSNEGAANTIVTADLIDATSNVWKGTAKVLCTARIL